MNKLRFPQWLESNAGETAVMVLICTKTGKALILKRGRTAPWKPNTWNLPGGGIDGDESPMAAAERECEEEAGIIPTNVKSLGVHNVIHGFVGYTDHDNVLIRATHGIIENDAWEWIDKEEIDKFVYADPNIPRMLHKVLRGSCQLPLSLIVVCNN